MTAIESIRPYLEATYFITGGPLLALFAFLALKQIQVAKQTSKTISKREAYRIAAEQAKSYATEIIPLINALDVQLKEHDLSFEDAEIKIENGKIKVRKKWSESDREKMIAVAPSLLMLINHLETWALFFVSGVASERVAFSSVGPSFVSCIRPLLPAFIGMTESGHYKNIMRLFMMWHDRVEKIKLTKERKQIDARLREINDKQITAIGTSDGG